jgi:protein-tyrosine phosphatase
VIDLHSHVLPGVDDGAPDLEASLAMARMAAEDGIQVMACTPHFMPGLYDNESADVLARIEDLNARVADAGIGLTLVSGADAHIRPDFLTCLRDGRILTLNNSRYVLFEPPHNILPQRLDDMLFNIVVAGYVPILTHPERMKWIEQSYAMMVELVRAGVWMQITAGSLSGRFGKRPRYWAERMLNEGLVHILATDAHNLSSRPPLLAEAREAAAAALGAEEADNLVLLRPVHILDDEPAETAPPLPDAETAQAAPAPLWRRLFAGG